jgi:hypothetical protein
MVDPGSRSPAIDTPGATTSTLRADACRAAHDAPVVGFGGRAADVGGTDGQHGGSVAGSVRTGRRCRRFHRRPPRSRYATPIRPRW